MMETLIDRLMDLYQTNPSPVQRTLIDQCKFLARKHRNDVTTLTKELENQKCFYEGEQLTTIELKGYLQALGINPNWNREDIYKRIEEVRGMMDRIDKEQSP